jgi:hypothetical protein
MKSPPLGAAVIWIESPEAGVGTGRTAGSVGATAGVGSSEGEGAGAGDPDTGSWVRAVAGGIGLGAAGDDPAGDGLVWVAAHAARRTPRRTDAAWHFVFIYRRRRRCGLSR